MKLSHVASLIRPQLGHTLNRDDAQLRLLRKLTSQKILPRMLVSLINDRDALRRVAKRSYTHNNGFDKIVLLRGLHPAHQLRLHIWWRGATADPHIHSHSANFATCLITGAYRMAIYNPGPSGSVWKQYRYTRPTKGSEGMLRYRGAAHLRITERYSLNAGDGYLLDYRVLHRITSSNRGLTSSLALFGPKRQTGADVYTLSSLTDEAAERHVFTTDSLRDRLERYLALLQT